jgi:hypothetical protein
MPAARMTIVVLVAAFIVLLQGSHGGQAGAKQADSGGLFTKGFVFQVVIHGDLLQVVGFKYLVAIHTTDVVDPVPTHHEFSSRVVAVWHRPQITPFYAR